MTKFNNIQEAIQWAGQNIPFCVKPKKPAKTQFVNCFTSENAFKTTAEAIGEAIFNLQDNSETEDKIKIHIELDPNNLASISLTNKNIRIEWEDLSLYDQKRVLSTFKAYSDLYFGFLKYE